ncbi:MAG: VanW family protein [Actinomycetia bacterium]|nr:VanW family protein [Actinomycetes bacterium]
MLWATLAGVVLGALGARPVSAPRPVDPAPIVLVQAPGANQPITRLAYRWASVTTNYNHASPSQALNIELTAKRLNGTVLAPGQVFSYYARVGPYTAENGYGWGRAFVGDRIVPSVGGGVCQGASTLYAAVLRTGLRVLERHPHGLLVPYLPPGEDATVAGDYLDFRFQNTSPGPVLITASAQNRTYHLTIWGAVPGPEIVVKHEILERYPFRTIVRTDATLKPGEEKVVAPGQEGVKARSWLEIRTPEGWKTRSLGIDRYRPSPRIILVGPGPRATTPVR